MGILKLNELFKARCQTEPYNKHHRVIIFDGSNLIFKTLCAEHSNLKKSGLIINQWGSVNTDLFSQISYIIKYSIDRIINDIIRYYQRGVEEIVLVLDPTESPKYVINTSFTYNHELQDILDQELKDNVDVEFTIKSEEQEKRRAQANKTENKTGFIEEIESFNDIEPEQREILKNIFLQSFMFNETRELLKLGSYILKEVYRTINDLNEHYNAENETKHSFRIINAIDEADLVIKNIAHEYDPTTPILVLSADTDYNVLFGDMPNVDTCSLMNPNAIYNPFNCWKVIFNDSVCYDYDHIIRLAPLFGNDYTVKEFLVSATNFDDVKKLYEGLIDRLKYGSTTKKITKFCKSIDPSLYNSNDVLDLNKLDQFLADWNESYFRHYYLSNIIYTNWMKYNKYTVMNVPDEFESTQELEAFWRLFITPPFTLYKWNGEYIFNDWNKFFSTIETIRFESVDQLIDYYYDNEYHDEAAEFL